MKKIILTAAFTLAVGIPAAGANECASTIRPDLLQQAEQIATNARDRMTVEHAEETTRPQAHGGGLGGQSLAKCLEKYKNISIAGALKVPSPLDILRAGLDQVGSAVCSKVDDLYNDTRRATEQRVSLPGSVGGARVGLPGTGDLANPRNTTISAPGVGVNVQPVTRPEGVLREQVNKARSSIGGIFR